MSVLGSPSALQPPFSLKEMGFSEVPRKPQLFQKAQSPLCLMHREPWVNFEVKDPETHLKNTGLK